MTDARPAGLDAPHPLRALLRNWLWERGRIGTRWLRCEDGTIGFDEGRKAAFADAPFTVVVLSTDGASAGQALTIHEPGVARLLKAAQLGRPEDAGPPIEVARAVQDCVEIGLCAAYQADVQASRLRWSQEPMFDDEIAAAVAEDVRRVWAPQRARLALYDWTVFHGLPTPLLTSDAPFVDWRVRAKPPVPFVSLPLGPYALLVGAPSQRTARAGPVSWQHAVAMGPFKDHNRHIVEGARRWIVGITDEQLAAVQGRFLPPEPVAGPPA